MKKVEIKKTEKQIKQEEIKQEAIKAGCLGWFLRMTNPGLLPK